MLPGDMWGGSVLSRALCSQPCFWKQLLPICHSRVRARPLEGRASAAAAVGPSLFPAGGCVLLSFHLHPGFLLSSTFRFVKPSMPVMLEPSPGPSPAPLCVPVSPDDVPSPLSSWSPPGRASGPSLSWSPDCRAQHLPLALEPRLLCLSLHPDLPCAARAAAAILSLCFRP